MITHRRPAPRASYARAALVRLSVVFAFATASCNNSNEYPDPPAQTYSVASFALDSVAGGATVTGASVSSEFFKAANVRPLIGRFIIESEHQAGSTPVVVLSYDFWKTRFQSRPEVIGTKIRLNGTETTIVGIAPQDFAKPKDAQLWVPRP